MTTENTAMTIQQRVSVALESSVAEKYLAELASKSKSIVAITNDGGRNECHRAAMVAKEARINIEKAGKSAREDATAFSKAVISEEARLVALIKPEENRLLAIRDDWDAKVKAEKEAAEELERQRIAGIKAKIAEFSAMVADAVMLEAHGAEQELEVALAVEIDDSYGEFYGDAVEAKAAAVAKLREIVATKTAAEALAAKIKAEQEAESARLAAEAQRLAAERAEMDRQRKEIADAKAEQDRIAAAQAAAAQAEANRLAAEEIRKIDEQRKAANESILSATKSPVLSEKIVADENARSFIDSIEVKPEVTHRSHDMKRLEFRSELIARIDAMSAVQMANLIAYLDAQVLRQKIAA